MKLEPITLTGKVARLEPLRLEHATALYEISREYPDLWQYMPVQQPRSEEQMKKLVSTVLQLQKQGLCVPFAIVDLASRRIVGETRYVDITPHHRSLEVGSTWLTPSTQRTGVNTECKYLLLRYAFETLGVIRVQFKTHHLNLKSQHAIERLGAAREGILRNHRIMPDGSYRHSVYFSIIESEWPQVKANLEAKLNSHNDHESSRI